MRLFRNLLFLIALVLLSQHSFAISAELREPQMQGIWFGDGIHPLNKNVLIIQNDEFVVISPLGRFTSTFISRHEEDGLNAIDIERYDGECQLGVYKLEKTKLYLKLAEPGKPRPTIEDVTFANGKPHWHTVFDRRPTQDGLAVLQKNLSKAMESTGDAISHTSAKPKGRKLKGRTGNEQGHSQH